MPKKLRYTHLLGLNARGLARKQKRQIVWNKYVKNNPRLQRNLAVKNPSERRLEDDAIQNECWDEYHNIQHELTSMKLKGFLSNPSVIKTSIKMSGKIFKKLYSLQMRIENFKFHLSVAVPNKRVVQCLQVLCKGSGILECKTSNHNNGYWLHLIQNVYQKSANQQHIEFQCKLLNFHSEDKSLKPKSTLLKPLKRKKFINKNARKQITKNLIKANLLKSKMQTKEQRKIYLPIINSNNVCSEAKLSEILDEYKHFILFFLFPDFNVDYNIINARKNISKHNNNNSIQRNNNNNNNNSSEDVFADNSNMDQFEFHCFGSVIENARNSVLCLQHFKGEYVVHVGELFGHTFDARNPCWGRTTSQPFQIALQSKFHKIYEYELPHWPLFRDTFSVWRRNKRFQLGTELFLSLTENEFHNDRKPVNTRYYQNIFQQRLRKKQKRNIFQSANYKPSEKTQWKPLD